MFKDISYLELLQPFCSVKRKYLCNYSRGYYEEHFFFNYLKFRPVVKGEMSFKDISYLELWQPSETISAILINGVMRNNSVKLFLF